MKLPSLDFILSQTPSSTPRFWMHAIVASKLQNGWVRVFQKANSFIYSFLEIPLPNFLLTNIYLFSKSWVSFDKNSRLFHTKNHATFANNFEIERAIASWKTNEVIYEHIKAQYLNMNILCAIAGQTCRFLQDYMELRPLTPYWLKSSL